MPFPVNQSITGAFDKEVANALSEHCIATGDSVLIQAGVMMFLSEIDWRRNCGANLTGQCNTSNCTYIYFLINNQAQSVWNPVLNTRDSCAFSISAIEDITGIAPLIWHEKHMAKGDKEGAFCSSQKALKRCDHCGAYAVSTKMNALLKEKIGDAPCYKCITSRGTKCTFCNLALVANGGATMPPRFIGRKYTNTAYGKYICEDTHHQFVRCFKCLKVFHAGDMDGQLCTSCGTKVINEYTYHPEAVFLKTDNDIVYRNTPWMGIELEVEMKKHLTTKRDLVAKRFNNDVSSVAYLKKDSSIVCGFEIVSHPGTFLWWTDPNNILIHSIQKLSRTCESFWTDTTGIHIHISSAAFSNFHKALFVRFMLTNKPFMSFVSERYHGTQAKFDPVFDTDLIFEDVIKRGVKLERHTAVNLNSSQPTVEIRMFKGNMRRERILKNIEFIHSVYEFSKMIKDALHTEAGTEWKMSEVHAAEEFLLTVPGFIKWVNTNKETYPNLHEFIKGYKRSA